MELSELEQRIDEVHESATPAVIRLDEGDGPKSRVAVLPSAYNPPTRAHLELLRAARSAKGVQSVAALLTTKNVAKGLYGASLAHRAGMLLAMSIEDPPLLVYVTNRAKIADQAKLLAATLPGVGVDMVVGYDTLVRVFDPQYYADMHEELASFFGAHRLIAANRAGEGTDEVRSYLRNLAVLPFADRIVVCTIGDEAAAMSSTAAREAIAAGRVPMELPPAVRAYIQDHGLYTDT